jgi:hypothetical protein
LKLSAWTPPPPPPAAIGTAVVSTALASQNVIDVTFCSQLQVAQGILDAQTTVNELEGQINDGDCSCRGKGKGKGKRRGKGKKAELANALNELRTSIGQASDGLDLALQGGIGVLEQQGKSIRVLFENAGLDVPPGF